MFRAPRTLFSFSRHLSQLPRSALHHNGPIHVQRVRFRRPFFTTKSAPRRPFLSPAQLTWLHRRVQSVFINVSLFAVFYYLMLTDDEEKSGSLTMEENDKGELKSTIVQGEQDAALTGNGGETLSESEGEDSETDEDEDGIPDTLPEDAVFIPLGFARQRPREFYTSDSPEWQSFQELMSNKNRGNEIRRTPSPRSFLIP